MSKSILLPCFLLLLITGCKNSPQDSLVGKWKTPDISSLDSETMTLWFRRENGTDYSATLSYTLDPNGTVIIEKGRDHAACCFGGIDKHFTDYRAKKSLSTYQQAEIRQMLVRLRPEKLSRDVPFALPIGCSFVMDSRPWNGVGFSAGKLGGAFVFQAGCKGPGADRVKSLLKSLLTALPPVEGAESFIPGQ